MKRLEAFGGGGMHSAFTDLPVTHLSAVASEGFIEGSSEVRVDDVVVFIALESLGTLAITGNMCLIIVLLRNKYLHRASFILMLSLAIADVLHGIVTTSFFYPPIVLKSIPVHLLGVRAFNVIDWTAWSITLTHMSAICLDRLVAIMLYGRYNMIMTVKRVRRFTIFCWSTFFALNTAYILLKFCCLIAPLRSNQFYTFGYGEFESAEEREASLLGSRNVFTFTYTPIELTTIVILSISNPITLIQLYRRHKRKLALRIQQCPSMEDHGHGTALKARSQWQRASTMLLEMSIRMGSKAISNDVRELASRRSNRQQQRILLQISVIAVIFYLYMSTYYLLYHVFLIENNFFYSTTHMINPVIYFSLNKEMRLQLTRAFSDFLNYICCTGAKQDYQYGSVRKTSGEQKSPPKTCKSTMTTGSSSITTAAGGIRSTRSRSRNSRVSTYKVENSVVGFAAATESSPLIPPNTAAIGNSTYSFNFHGQIPKSVSKTILKEVLTEELNKIISKEDQNSREDIQSIVLPATTLQEKHSIFQKQQLECLEQPAYPVPKQKNSSESIIIDLEESVEKLELDLVSSCSLANDIARTFSAHSCSLAKKLEEHANCFIEAENVAIKKAREQRTSLLDSLIRALNLYPEEEEEGDAAVIDLLGGQALKMAYEAPSSSLVLINEENLKPHISRKYSKSMELSKLNGCIPNTLSMKIPSPALRNDLNVGSMGPLSAKTPELVNGGLHSFLPESIFTSAVHTTRGRSNSYSEDCVSNLAHSASWRQWKKSKVDRGGAFAKITANKVKESLLVLLDEAPSTCTGSVVNEDFFGEDEAEGEEEEDVVFL